MDSLMWRESLLKIRGPFRVLPAREGGVGGRFCYSLSLFFGESGVLAVDKGLHQKPLLMK